MGYYHQESLYKPYKYHGYTVRGTPHCPLTVITSILVVHLVLAHILVPPELAILTIPEIHPAHDVAWSTGKFIMGFYYCFHIYIISMQLGSTYPYRILKDNYIYYMNCIIVYLYNNQIIWVLVTAQMSSSAEQKNCASTHQHVCSLPRAPPPKGNENYLPTTLFKKLDTQNGYQTWWFGRDNSYPT